MDSVESFRDLIVWQKSVGLSVLVYKLTSLFPKHEIYGLTSQLRRASVSIASNIAEGYGRASTGEYSISSEWHEVPIPNYRLNW